MPVNLNMLNWLFLLSILYTYTYLLIGAFLSLEALSLRLPAFKNQVKICSTYNRENIVILDISFCWSKWTVWDAKRWTLFSLFCKQKVYCLLNHIKLHSTSPKDVYQKRKSSEQPQSQKEGKIKPQWRPSLAAGN